MTTINIGTVGSKNIGFDLDILLRTRLLIQANSGSGKSYLLRRLAEQAFGKVQIIIIDPEGEFSTLREKFDFVLVGKGGETPADTRSAGLVAQKLLELHASAVCDLYEMKVSDRHRWVRLFLEALIDAPKKLWHPVLVIVDEAHIFAPEKGAGESEASEAMIGLATRGRKRGFCPVFATQRLGKLRKDAASELQNILVGGTFIDVDRKRAAESLGISTVKNELHSFFDEIKILEPGQFWALGRAISRERVLAHIGKVATTHPEPGSTKQSAEPPPAPDRIRALLPKLSDLPQEAEQKIRTEKELRAEVDALRRQLRERPVETIPQKEIQYVDVPAFQNNEVDSLQKTVNQLSDLASQFTSQYRDVAQVVRNIQQRPVQRHPVSPAPRQAPVVHRSTALQAPEGDGETLPQGEMKILTACGQYPDGVGRKQLTVLTGYKRSTRDAYIKRLSLRGYVQTVGDGSVTITQDGYNALGTDFSHLPVGDELYHYWLERLPEGEKRILVVLHDAYPDQVARDYITEVTGYKRSTRDAYLKRMQAKFLVVSHSSGVSASAELFD